MINNEYWPIKTEKVFNLDELRESLGKKVILHNEFVRSRRIAVYAGEQEENVHYFIYQAPSFSNLDRITLHSIEGILIREGRFDFCAGYGEVKFSAMIYPGSDSLSTMAVRKKTFSPDHVGYSALMDFLVRAEINQET